MTPTTRTGNNSQTSMDNSNHAKDGSYNRVPRAVSSSRRKRWWRGTKASHYGSSALFMGSSYVSVGEPRIDPQPAAPHLRPPTTRPGSPSSTRLRSSWDDVPQRLSKQATTYYAAVNPRHPATGNQNNGGRERMNNNNNKRNKGSNKTAAVVRGGGAARYTRRTSSRRESRVGGSLATNGTTTGGTRSNSPTGHHHHHGNSHKPAFPRIRSAASPPPRMHPATVTALHPIGSMADSMWPRANPLRTNHKRNKRPKSARRLQLHVADSKHDIIGVGGKHP